ncbi:hypothetical protein L810_1507 [Burkholderia sp. AU4i]|nr:hypothetical protein L810_1507 [Burkholderia sp. AU4i]
MRYRARALMSDSVMLTNYVRALRRSRESTDDIAHACHGVV